MANFSYTVRLNNYNILIIYDLKFKPKKNVYVYN